MDIRDRPLTSGEIEFRVEGSEGHISLDVLVSTLSSSLALLQSVDKALTDRSKPTLEWFVSDLRTGSAVAVVESRPLPVRHETADPEQVASVVISGTTRLVEAGSLPDYFNEAAVRAVERIAGALRSGARGLTVSDGSGKTVFIGGDVTARVKDARKVVQTVYGSVMGRLDQISVRRGSKFMVKDEITGRSISCVVDNEQLELAKRALGHRVIAGGQLRANQLGDTVSILLDTLEVLPSQGDEMISVSDIVGLGDWTDGENAGDYIARLRDPERRV